MAQRKVTRTVTYLEDAGHAWMSVAHSDIKALGLQHSISSFSYINGTRVYLEEDCDAPKFEDAARRAGWVLKGKSRRCDSDYSWVRNLPHYSAKYLDFALKVNTVVELCDGVRGRIVHYLGKTSFIIQTVEGRLFRVPKSNPFRYLTPIGQGVGYTPPVKTDRNPQFNKRRW